MLLQVHDELVFDVFKPELEALKKMIRSEMENAFEDSLWTQAIDLSVKGVDIEGDLPACPCA